MSLPNLFVATGTPGTRAANFNDLERAFSVQSGYNIAKLVALGFTGNGTASDRAAIQAFIDSTTGDIQFHFPAGMTIALDGPIKTPGSRNVRIEGRATFVMLKPNVNAWQHGVGAPGTGTFDAHDLTFRPHPQGGGVAFNLSFIGLADPTGGHYSIKNCTFGFEGSKAPSGVFTSWAIGLAVLGAWNSDIENCVIMMPNAGPGVTAQGVLIGGTEGSAPSNPVSTATTFSGVLIQGGLNAIAITGQVQGIHLVNCNLVGCDYGVYWPAGPADGADLLTIASSHINAGVRGIYCSNVLTTQTSGGVYFLHFPSYPPSAGLRWAAVELDEPGKSSLQSCNVLGQGNLGYAEYGVWLHGTGGASHYPSMVCSNVFQSIGGPGVQIDGAVSKVSVFGNNFEGQGAAGFTTAGVVQNLSTDSTGNYIGLNVNNGLSPLEVNYADRTVFSGFNWSLALLNCGQITGTTLIDTGGLEVGKSGVGQNIDFHSTGAGVQQNDYDFRLLGQNAGSGSGQGDLYAIGRRLYLQTAFNLVLPSYASDAAAAAGGVMLNDLYRNGNVVQVRIA